VEGEASQSLESVRIDLWSWSVRLYKTREQAGAACKKAQLLVNGQRCRAARPVRVGDEISLRQGLLVRTLAVKALLRRRVGAREVPTYLLDLTPAEEYERVAAIEREAREATPQREAGSGRPTKRDRREMDGIGPFDGGPVDGFGEEPTEAPSFDEFVKAFLKPPKR